MSLSAGGGKDMSEQSLTPDTMMFLQLFTNPLFFFVWAVSLVLAVTVHEYAHAFVADKLGDPTPRLMGRVTLNPIAHLDPLGTLAMLFAGFGWGRPVPFDPFNLENPKRDAALISVAGPASNILLVILFVSLHAVSLLPTALAIILVQMNLMLALFNLIPVHPLDGFKIVGGLLSDEQADEWNRLAPYGMYILLLLILPITPAGSIISLFFQPALTFLMTLIF